MTTKRNGTTAAIDALCDGPGTTQSPEEVYQALKRDTTPTPRRPANIMDEYTAVRWIRSAYQTGRHNYGDISVIRDALQDMMDRLEANDWWRADGGEG